jgi:hypothetical protein
VTWSSHSLRSVKDSNPRLFVCSFIPSFACQGEILQFFSASGNNLDYRVKNVLLLECPAVFFSTEKQAVGHSVVNVSRLKSKAAFAQIHSTLLWA